MSGNDRVCAVCGEALPPRRHRYCSADCAASARRNRAASEYKPIGKPSLYREKQCPDCGITFVGHIKSRRCPSCQHAANKIHDAEHKRRAAKGQTRKLGSTDSCILCGKPYTVMAGQQKYCEACAPVANRKWHADKAREYYSIPENAYRKKQSRKRAPQQYTCQVCGGTFVSGSFCLTCSTECRRLHQTAYMAVYDNRRTDSRRVYNRSRWESLSREQKNEINRKARDAYHKRKSRED